jgi:hypothetical protein
VDFAVANDEKTRTTMRTNNLHTRMALTSYYLRAFCFPNIKNVPSDYTTFATVLSSTLLDAMGQSSVLFAGLAQGLMLPITGQTVINRRLDKWYHESHYY